MSRYDAERMPEERRHEIQNLLRDAAELINEATIKSTGYMNYMDSFTFDELGYGAGSTLSDGKWTPSSSTC